MTINAIPESPNRQDIPNFSAQTDTVFTALPTYATEFNSSEPEALDPAQAAITSNQTAQSSLSTAQTVVASATALYDNFDDRYLGVKASNPTLDNDGNALITGTMYWNSSSGNMLVWSGSIWLVVESAYSVSESNSNRSSIQAVTSQTENYKLNTQDSADYFRQRYIGAFSSDPAGPAHNTMYWNSSLNEMRIWTGTEWKNINYDTVISRAGDTVSGTITAPAVIVGNLVVSGGLNYFASQALSSGGRGISSQTQIRHKYLDIGDGGPDLNINLPFITSPVIRLTPTEDKVLSCNQVPPAGTRCTLIVQQPSPNPGYQSLITFSTNIRRQSDFSTYNTAGACMVIKFISNGTVLLETSRSGPV